VRKKKWDENFVLELSGKNRQFTYLISLSKQKTGEGAWQEIWNYNLYLG
jgi:hypothetical protein